MTYRHYRRARRLRMGGAALVSLVVLGVACAFVSPGGGTRVIRRAAPPNTGPKGHPGTQETAARVAPPPVRRSPHAAHTGDRRTGRVRTRLNGRLPARRPPRSREVAVVYYAAIAGGLPLHVVQADLNNPDLRLAVATAGGGIGYRDSWGRIIARTRPTAAITGTYFDPASALPVGSIVVQGKPVHGGAVGTALAFRAPGRVRMKTLRAGERFDGSHYDTVLRAGPRLVAGGRIVLSPRREGFRDPGIWARKRRALVGITRHHKLLLLGVRRPITLREAARAALALGARDAMCLDGGNSAGLYYRGKTHLAPRRPLTNLLVIYDRASTYKRVAQRLTPNRSPKMATKENERT
ncbi:MAG: phosphodiester glycosidase family protein [Armatimonadetes bacterium]|nr:phosphodiester glycosidase family protein [Armatimonadota bacterium]